MTVREIAAYQLNAMRTNYTGGIVRQSSTTQVIRPNASAENQNTVTNQESLQFLNQYKSKTDGLKSAADKVRSLSENSVWSDLDIHSSDSSVVSNATAFGKIPQRAEYDIDVRQLAQAQITAVAVPDSGFQDGSFTIESMGTDGNPVSTSIQIDTRGGMASQQEILENIAEQINNNLSLGVSASLTEENGSFSLRLKSHNTGADSRFTVSGTDSRNLQEAQDLKYTLNGREYSSDHNHSIRIAPDGDNRYLRLDFNSVGRASVTADVNQDKLARYTEAFVKAYNETVDFLVDNAHRGSGVKNVLDRLTQAPVSADSMESIGLSFGHDGKITFDADRFKEAMEEDTRNVYDILADNYSVADGIYQKADNASRLSPTSLLDKSQLHSNTGNTIIINNYYNYTVAPYPVLYPVIGYPTIGYPAFSYTGPLFFNTKI